MRYDRNADSGRMMDIFEASADLHGIVREADWLVTMGAGIDELVVYSLDVDKASQCLPDTFEGYPVRVQHSTGLRPVYVPRAYEGSDG